MNSPPASKRPLSRNTLYLIVAAYLVVTMLIWHWAHLLGGAFILVNIAAAGYMVHRNRQHLGRFVISTQCASCGAMLQEHFGIPERTCGSCGRKQPWSK